MTKRALLLVAGIALCLSIALYGALKSKGGNGEVSSTLAQVPKPAVGSGGRTRTPPAKYLPVKIGPVPSNVIRVRPHATFENPVELVSEVTAAADDGSASDMYYLSVGLRACATADMSSNEDIEAKEARRSIGREAMAKDAGNVIDQAGLARDATAEAHRLENIRDQCKTLPADRIASWRDWLEKSAAAGDPVARERLAHTVMDDYKDADFKLEHYEEFKAQNDRALAYLQDSIANGMCDNITLNGLRWVRADPTTTYVYQSLLWKYWLSELPNIPNKSPGDVDRETMEIMAALRNLASNVPASELAQADDASNYILQNICTTLPDAR